MNGFKVNQIYIRLELQVSYWVIIAYYVVGICDNMTDDVVDLACCDVQTDGS